MKLTLYRFILLHEKKVVTEVISFKKFRLISEC
jgi:hypothetical protein